MRTIKIIFFIFFFSLFSPSSYALNLCEKESEYFIGFFNGVKNSKEDAKDSLNRLKEICGLGYRGTRINYDVFYNTSISLVVDAWEALKMRTMDVEELPEDFLKLPGDTFDHYEGTKYSSILEEYTMNTRKRAERYFQYNRALLGITLGDLPKGDTCEVH